MDCNHTIVKGKCIYCGIGAGSGYDVSPMPQPGVASGE